jgi:ABC-type uncharacterized transport system substrate-binding protein
MLANSVSCNWPWLAGDRMQFDQVRRRAFITLLGGAAAAWPLAGRAQQPERKRRIGVLMAHAENDAEFHDYLAAFREGLQKLGWTEGRNIQIDSRWGALDDAEARQRSAKELIALQPDLILTQNTPPTASMLEQTRTLPVVFVIVVDPVGSGFVQSLARPGANATGFTIMEPTIAGKWLELLKEIAPRVNRAAAPAREFRSNSVASLRERSRAKYSADTSAARQSVKPNPGLLDSADALNDPVPLAIKVGVICALVQRSASLVARLNRAYMMRLH